MTSFIRSDIRPAEPSDVESLVHTKVAAFYDDPVEQWLFPDSATRHDSLRRAYRVGVRADLRAGKTWCTDDALAFATWRKPTDRPVGILRSVLSQVSLAPLVPKFGPPFRVVLGLGKLFAEHRPPEPHWRLTSVGTDPAARGEARASSLIARGLAECDAALLPCSVVSTNLENSGFYERFGFEVTAEVQLPYGGPGVAMMTRQVLAGKGRADTNP